MRTRLTVMCLIWGTLAALGMGGCPANSADSTSTGSSALDGQTDTSAATGENNTADSSGASDSSSGDSDHSTGPDIIANNGDSTGSDTNNNDTNDDTTDTAATRLRAHAGYDQSVQGGSLVTLDGTASSGNRLTYEWKQTLGSTVELSDSKSITPTFTAPAYKAGATNRVEFKLYVRDLAGKEAGDRVRISIVEPTDDGGAPPPPPPPPTPKRVRITTTLGAFTVELDAEKAPLTTQNFLRYVDDKFYEGTIFHRVIPGFVVQGGGFLPDMSQKQPRSPIMSEANNGLKNLRGTLAMARQNDPNSATSQFYVNLVDNANLDYSTANPGYTVFGRIVEGMEIIDQIAAVPTGAENFFSDVPTTDIVIQIAERVAGP